MLFEPFPLQEQVLTDPSRYKILLAGKRSGKSEVCYIESIMKAHQQPGYDPDTERDPFEMAIIAPSWEMLQTLVWPKFRRFARGFEAEFNKQYGIFTWRGKDTIIYSASGEKIQRIEGKKLRHIHMTEAFQMGHHVWLEAIARTSDTKGTITLDGSLGPTFQNPQAHWIYKTFVEKQPPDTRVWIWHTKDNPYFPQDELERQRQQLDGLTFRQMYELDFDTPNTAAVYQEFDEDNQMDFIPYRKDLPTYVSVDWGWAHEMACLFFQIETDKRGQPTRVYLIDEIVSSRLTLDTLWDRIKAKGYVIKEYLCDIAGTQERELVGRSNVQWFRDPPRGVHFKYRKSSVGKGISLVRSWVKNSLGQKRFFICKAKCPRSIDGMKSYSYPEKDGMITNENPVKKADDCVDAIRYLFWNVLDPGVNQSQWGSFDRWGKKTWQA